MLIEDVNQELLVDKVLERLAVEEAGVRLHELCAQRAAAQAPALEERFRRMAEQEREHVVILSDLLRRFGREPGRTRSHASDLARLRLAPLLELCAEPTTGLHQALECVLQAELADQAGWEILEELGKRATIDEDVLRDFRHAARTEKEHVHWVRTHLERLLTDELALVP